MTTDQVAETPCKNAHTWTQQHDADPERGTPCDCGKRQWGIPLVVKREHEWQSYANGSFCRRCGTSIGSGMPCR